MTAEELNFVVLPLMSHSLSSTVRGLKAAGYTSVVSVKAAFTLEVYPPLFLYQKPLLAPVSFVVCKGARFPVLPEAVQPEHIVWH